MENQETGPALAAASDTKATDDRECEALAEIVAQRRQDLGIKDTPDPAKVGDVATKILSRLKPWTPEEIERHDRLILESKRREEAEERRKAFDALVGKAGDRYRSCTVESFRATLPKQQVVKAAVTEYVESLPERIESRQGLVLYGPVGTGKDHLAFAVAVTALMRHRMNVGWVNGQDWFGDLRDNMSTEDVTERQLLDRLAYPQLLVISDPLPPIGNLGQHMATMLYRLVGKRYESGKPTIVTVNVKDDAEADERLGVPTWDRICDGAWKVACQWPSHRKPAREIK